MRGKISRTGSDIGQDNLRQLCKEKEGKIKRRRRGPRWGWQVGEDVLLNKSTTARSGAKTKTGLGVEVNGRMVDD